MAEMSAGRASWLSHGLALVAEQGAPALTLERLCERVGMSKGAFYHHFGSVPKYRATLLEHFEATYTTAIVDEVEEPDGLPPRERLSRLLALSVKDSGPHLESAMRAWAKQDAEAAAVQRRVDATRIRYLRRLCAGADLAEPERVATLLYLVLVGAEHVMPALPKQEVREIYALLLPLLLDEAGPKPSLAEGAAGQATRETTQETTQETESQTTKEISL